MNRIVIIGAMPSELADIRTALGTDRKQRISGFEYYINEYKGREIISACCGIAKVNAALCTQVAIDNFKPDCVINTGIAGGMNDAVKVCDIVISTEVLTTLTHISLRTIRRIAAYSRLTKSSLVLQRRYAVSFLLRASADVSFRARHLFPITMSKRI